MKKFKISEIRKDQFDHNAFCQSAGIDMNSFRKSICIKFRLVISICLHSLFCASNKY